jgi:hypothetical protein
MAEVLVQFDEPQQSADGRYFVAQVCGRRGSGGLWEAWIEFHGRDGGELVQTACETEQLSRGDLRYWAAGLTRGYLQGALERAMAPQLVGVSRLAAAFAGFVPPRVSEHVVLETNALTYSVPVLDPVNVYRQSGEYTLRQELRALSAQHLGDIIAAFDIPEIDIVDLSRTFEDALAERIVAGVQQRVGKNRESITPSQLNREQK